MSLLDTFKNVFVAPVEEDYEDDEMEMNEEEYVEEEPKKFGFAPFTMKRSEPAVEESRPAARPAESDRSNTIHARGQLHVVLVKPSHFEEVRGIADQMIDNNTVLLNMENADDAEARRMVDFLSGVIYARGGKAQKHGRKTVILAPKGVELHGESIYAEMDVSAESMF